MSAVEEIDSAISALRGARLNLQQNTYHPASALAAVRRAADAVHRAEQAIIDEAESPNLPTYFLHARIPIPSDEYVKAHPEEYRARRIVGREVRTD